jgi:hypothetical protein
MDQTLPAKGFLFSLRKDDKLSFMPKSLDILWVIALSQRN